MLLVIVNFMASSCSAFSYHDKKEILSTQKDSVMRKAIGDSIYTIITEAKSVSASLKLRTTDNQKDSIVTIKVNKNEKSILNFILSAPSNFERNDIVYGKYLPNFFVTFIANKGKKCYAYFDFGLKKWAILNSDGKELVRYDLPTNDVLRLANQIFPECNYFNVLLNNK